MPSLTLIIPAYNEAQALLEFLPQVIGFCKQKGFKLIVINDGSTDETASVLNRFSNESFFKIIHNKVNNGYGGAIKKGIRAADTDYIITLDADGQHNLEDVEKLFQEIIKTDADMVVGCRNRGSVAYRKLGKWLIRKVAGMLMPLNIKDINSGIKIYNASIAKKYISICPETMAFSDIILLAFVYKKHRVTEVPVSINPRLDGKSTVNTLTAIDTLKEIVNIVVLFNPMRIFFPAGTLFIAASILWDIPIFLRGNGVSVGSLLGIMTGITFYFFGLIAHQISAFRKASME